MVTQRSPKDVVLFPCYNRPEMLYVNLEHVMSATYAPKLLFVFQLDHGFDPDILNVINSFDIKDKIVCMTPPHDHKSKLTYNILTGYYNACELAKKYVFMIEEDIFVSKDFFRWHYKVHEDAQLFASIACENHNTDVEVSPELKDKEFYTYYTTKGDYQSWGLCFDKAVLQDKVLRQFNDNYIKEPREYLKRVFPDFGINEGQCEQAGMIRRLEMTQFEPIAFPYIARAFHGGFYGKNRDMEVSGDLQDRIDMVESIAFSTEENKRLQLGKSFRGDSEAKELQHGRSTTKVIHDRFVPNERVSSPFDIRKMNKGAIGSTVMSEKVESKKYSTEDEKYYDRDAQKRRMMRKRDESLRGNDHYTLSILIPTLHSRRKDFNRIYKKLLDQILLNDLLSEVELVWERDMGVMPIGYKRNELMIKARGRYIAFVDDDDEVSDDYVRDIYENLDGVDAVTFNALYCPKNQPKAFLMRFELGEEEYRSLNGTFFRPPGHLNAIKKAVALKFPFNIYGHPGQVTRSERNDNGSDVHFSKNMARENAIETAHYIDKILYYYEYRPKKERVNE